MEKNKKDFTTKKELFKYLRDKCGDKLDELFVIDVRANVLREIYDDISRTDEYWGGFMRRQEKIEEGLKFKIKKLELEVKRIQKQKDNWKDMYNKLTE